MFSRKMLKLLVISFFVFSFGINNANAYTCWGWTPDQAKTVKKDADVVFVGKISNISTLESDDTTIGDHKFLITFSKKAVWKGDIKKDSLIVNVDSVYKYDFQLNSMYLVYGYKIHNDDTISVVGCPRAKLISNSIREIGYLGKAIFPDDFKIGDLGEYTNGNQIIVEVLKNGKSEKENNSSSGDSNSDKDNIIDKDIDLPDEADENDGNMEVEMNSAEGDAQVGKEGGDEVGDEVGEINNKILLEEPDVVDITPQLPASTIE